MRLNGKGRVSTNFRALRCLLGQKRRITIPINYSTSEDSPLLLGESHRVRIPDSVCKDQTKIPLAEIHVGSP